MYKDILGVKKSLKNTQKTKFDFGMIEVSVLVFLITVTRQGMRTKIRVNQLM